MAVRIRLPGGILKIKSYRELRQTERERKVPTWRWGWLYFVWWGGQTGRRAS
jgi:hypothetical protein